mgnify:CR=1 FL=1
MPITVNVIKVTELFILLIDINVIRYIIILMNECQTKLAWRVNLVLQ